MDAARSIRTSLDTVAQLRREAQADPALGLAVREVKALQARRFRGTYADLLADPVYAPAARFFLEELYGERDFAQRDDQFARIAGAIEKLFPAQVAATAGRLADLHAQTETLDLQVARGWRQEEGAPEPMRYALAWRHAGGQSSRRGQLASVVGLGQELASLTRMPGLRLMLRMMRTPASAAGLGALQSFLENGFDTFAGMAKRQGAAERFLASVETRESALLALLFEGELVACETELARILGQAR
ncbi:MAG: hypothetical protein NDI68_06895 [Arenimonas sp.]|nr:hypothetical protein [Arenimonas sp.]